MVTDPRDEFEKETPIFLEGLAEVNETDMDPNGIVIEPSFDGPIEPTFIDTTGFFQEVGTETKIKSYMPFAKPKAKKMVSKTAIQKKKKAKKQQKKSRRINRK